jgi:hypothetical protein
VTGSGGNGPAIHLTKDEIARMEKNVPTRRVYGTDASLDWPEQLEQVRKACSKAVTKLNALLDTVADGDEVADIVRALNGLQSMALKATGSAGLGGDEPTDAQLMKVAKK